MLKFYYLAHFLPKYAQNSDVECIYAVKSWVNNVTNYALLRCKSFGQKIWLCKILDKHHVCAKMGEDKYKYKTEKK